jgi:hypothetical protein
MLQPLLVFHTTMVVDLHYSYSNTQVLLFDVNSLTTFAVNSYVRVSHLQQIITASYFI